MVRPSTAGPLLKPPHKPQHKSLPQGTTGSLDHFAEATPVAARQQGAQVLWELRSHGMGGQTWKSRVGGGGSVLGGQGWRQGWPLRDLKELGRGQTRGVGVM